MNIATLNEDEFPDYASPIVSGFGLLILSDQDSDTERIRNLPDVFQCWVLFIVIKYKRAQKFVILWLFSTSHHVDIELAHRFVEERTSVDFNISNDFFELLWISYDEV